MIMALRPIISKEEEGSGHNIIDHSSLKIQFKTVYTIELECILNGLPWHRSVLSKCF